MNEYPAEIALREPSDLALEVFEQIVVEGRSLALHGDLLDALAESRATMLAALARSPAVYGVNTGMGYLVDRKLTEEEQTQHQANLLLGRAVGGPPFLDPIEARGIILARLGSFLSGHAGVSPALCGFLVDRLNDGFTPAIPRTRIGCAGEIIPLAHAFQTLMGVGHVIAPDGGLTAARHALAHRGVAPYQPAVKEGIALIAGSPGAVALAALHRRAAAILSRQLLTTWACAIDAMRAPLSPYDSTVARLANDPLMADVLDQLNTLLAGSDPERGPSQAPVSFRVVPQVLTHLVRTIRRLEEDVRRHLGVVSDSPAFVDGSFVTSGGFHAIDLAAGMDSLCIALAQAAELAGQHVHRLLDHRFSGLPDQLTPNPGLHSGLISVHKRVVGAVHELRRLAAPASVGLVDTSLGQEDAMTFAFEAADKLRRAEELMREVIACELLVVRQAWAMRSAPVATGLRQYADELVAAVEPVDVDRPLGPEIDTVVSLLARDAI